jgi:hypothetical protein
MEEPINYEVSDKIYIEYRDNIKKYIADIAIINDTTNKVKYIFEIKYSHATITNVRPEPWFEIDANEILEKESEDGTMYICCLRNRNCSNCRAIESNWGDNLPRLNKKYGIETYWTQDKPCMKCGAIQYNPIFIKGPRQICKMCIQEHEEELKKEYTDDFILE